MQSYRGYARKDGMRIGTISLNINAPDFNYGAVLHSWAFQQYLGKLNFVEYTEIIDYTMPKLEGQNLKYPVLTNLKQKHLRRALKYMRNHRLYDIRYKKFCEFISNNILKSDIKYTQKKLNNAKIDYDCVICESDVIWSPGFSGGHFDKSFFMALDSMSDLKRIAYAPSMANGDLNREQEDELKELLKYPQFISCRESYEKEILEKYTDKTITHVLDPVMLLEAGDYDVITADKMVKENYLLLYLPVDDNVELRKYANQYAKKKGLKVVEISTYLNSKNSENEICYGAAGIEEFLSLIKNAEIVFTNSFHAICFAIIFNIQFYAFSRAYAGKVKDICNVFELQERYFEDNIFRENEPIDYEKVNKIRDELAEKSKQWLISSLQ